MGWSTTIVAEGVFAAGAALIAHVNGPTTVVPLLATHVCARALWRWAPEGDCRNLALWTLGMVGIRECMQHWNGIHATTSGAVLVGAAYIMQSWADNFAIAMALASADTFARNSPDAMARLMAWVLALTAEHDAAENNARARRARYRAEDSAAALDLHAPLRMGVSPDDTVECAVCLADIPHTELRRILRCGHTFHAKCVDEWFAVYGNPRCPTCRAAIVPPAEE